MGSSELVEVLLVVEFCLQLMGTRKHWRAVVSENECLSAVFAFGKAFLLADLEQRDRNGSYRNAFNV